VRFRDLGGDGLDDRLGPGRDDHDRVHVAARRCVGRYQAVDVSVQPDNGVTTRADDSVLRAAYA
jgi:hypothetical protein